MATSSELYAEQAKLIEAKAQLNANVSNFLSICSGGLSKANAIIQECLACNDTNIKSIAASGGCMQKLGESISKLQDKVNTALASANSSIQAEIDELGRQAALAAAREAAMAQARYRQRANSNVSSNSNQAKPISRFNYIMKE